MGVRRRPQMAVAHPFAHFSRFETLLAVVSELGGLLEFRIRLLEQGQCFRGVATELVLVFRSGCFGFLIRLDDQPLRFGQVRVELCVDVAVFTVNRPLGRRARARIEGVGEAHLGETGQLVFR